MIEKLASILNMTNGDSRTVVSNIVQALWANTVTTSASHELTSIFTKAKISSYYVVQLSKRAHISESKSCSLWSFIINLWIDRFHDLIWLSCCANMIDWERSNSINNVIK